MKVQGLLLVAFILIPAFESQTTPGPCCQKKTVTSSDGQGVYTFLRAVDSSEQNSNCADGCIYTKEGSPSSDEYCFKQVDSGAAAIEDECDASPAPTEEQSSQPPEGSSSPPSEGSSSQPPEGSSSPPSEGSSSQPPEGSSSSPPEGSSSPPPESSSSSPPEGSSSPTSQGSSSPEPSGSTEGPTSTAGTTLNPETLIAEANKKIDELNNKINEETTKQSTAASASTKVDEINSALSTGTTPAGRMKRQAASTTPAAGSCEEFTNNFVQLLDLLQALSDDDLDQVKTLVTFFTNALPNIPCTSTEKNTIKNDNAAKVTAAQAGVDTYKKEKDTIILGYHEEVEKENEKIDNANIQLASMGRPTIAATTLEFTPPPTPPTNGAATSAAGPTEGSTAPGSNGPTEGSTSPGSNGPTEGSSGPTEGLSAPGSSGPTEGSSAPGSSGPTEGSSAPGSSGPTEGSSVPGSSGPTEGSSAPGSSGPTEGSTAPGSAAPGSSDPTPTGGVTSTVSSGGRRSRRFLQNLPLLWERK